MYNKEVMDIANWFGCFLYSNQDSCGTLADDFCNGDKAASCQLIWSSGTAGAGARKGELTMLDPENSASGTEATSDVSSSRAAARGRALRRPRGGGAHYSAATRQVMWGGSLL